MTGASRDGLVGAGFDQPVQGCQACRFVLHLRLSKRAVRPVRKDSKYQGDVHEPEDPPNPLQQRESMDYDVVIVGGGPAGLSAAIRLKQLAQSEREVSVCVLEKGSEIGAHILSGAVLDPRALDRTDPRLEGKRRAGRDRSDRRPLLLLHPERRDLALPHFLFPPLMSNHGNYIVSLSNLCKWLGAAGRSAGRGNLSRLSGP